MLRSLGIGIVMVQNSDPGPVRYISRFGPVPKILDWGPNTAGFLACVSGSPKYGTPYKHFRLEFILIINMNHHFTY